MKRLPDISPNVIDAPFNPAYSNMVEPYFIASSKFYLGMPSGPYSIAFAFNIPILLTNYTISIDDGGGNKDILLPKKHYSKRFNRCLCYEEVVCSPLTEYFHSNKFQEAGIDLIENTSQEIFEAVKEMDQRLEGRYEFLDEANCRFKILKDIDRKAHIYRQTMELCPPLWGIYLSNASVSNEFLRMNPYFLSRDYGIGNHYVRPLEVSQEEESYCFGPVI
jgi:putative glycosyltransferase (TIGR04372 family)